jgi:predicted house-cleaning NTP pyrophosphatase (Maf/HAM1 superfamily)
MIVHLVQQINAQVRIVLASSSPRRLEILGIIGLKPEVCHILADTALLPSIQLLQVIVSGFAEDIDKKGLSPQQCVLSASICSVCYN